MFLFVFIRLLEGGAESGYRHVTPAKYIPRLFHFHGTGTNVVVKQVFSIFLGHKNKRNI